MRRSPRACAALPFEKNPYLCIEKNLLKKIMKEYGLKIEFHHQHIDSILGLIG
jgi:hypothetical protein